MPEFKRTLAAVMFTDMVGFTALMQQDEAEAARLRDRHRAVLQKCTDQYGGRILQYYGDGTLSIFESALEAVRCGVAIQQELRRAPVVPLRIGIHSGDIVYDEEGIYGDGVNVASRIESFSVAGALLISEKVYDEIKNQPGLPALPMGKFELKNVRRPLDLYAVAAEGLHLPKPAELKGKGQPFVRTIAVLPFVNMSSDPENEFFSDGITEEILHTLARLEGLSVTSRTSSFAFKGRTTDIREIARQLGVNTVLEGSVRKAGKRVRITAQLINAVDDHHLWSETYDRSLDDIFEVQDEIARAIAGRLQAILTGPARQPLIVEATTHNLPAYELYLKGRFHWHRYTPDDARQALRYYEQAAALAPDFVLPYCGQATAYTFLGALGAMTPTEAFAAGRAAALRALAIDDNHCEPHLAMALIHFFFDWDWDAAEASFRRALAINPSEGAIYQGYYMFLAARERLDEAVEIIQEAFRLDPLNLLTRQSLAQAYLFSGNFEQAAETLDQIFELDPDFRSAHELLCWFHFFQDDWEAAEKTARHLYHLTKDPLKGFSPLAFVLGKRGRRDEARQYLGMLHDRARRDGEANLAIDFAFIHLGLGNPQEAIRYLEMAADARLGAIVFAKVSPIWNPLHPEKRFGELLQRIGLTEREGREAEEQKNRRTEEQKNRRTEELKN